MKYAPIFACVLSILAANAVYADDDDDQIHDSTLMFNGYPCTIDCSGHEAGYNWAEQHDITDPDDCGGKSESFIEGCRSYTEDPLNTDDVPDDADSDDTE